MADNKKNCTPTSVYSFFKWEHLVAGVSGGVVSTLVLHPLDLIKVRFAVNDGTNKHPKYRNIRGAFTGIVKNEGFRGLYKGVSANLYGSGTAWGLYFLLYNTIKIKMQNGDPNNPVGPLMHMTAASEAGLLTLMMTNPIWVVKTRLCLQYDSSSNDNKIDTKYKGVFDALRKIYHLEGIRGLYRGFVPGIFGVSHGAIQFMAYEELKNRYNQYRNVSLSTKMSTIAYLTFSSTSKIIAVAATYPYQVVRARLQDKNHNYAGICDCIQKIWKYESWRGYYKGMGSNLIRVTPGTMITFVTYEHVTDYLKS